MILQNVRNHLLSDTLTFQKTGTSRLIFTVVAEQCQYNRDSTAGLACRQLGTICLKFQCQLPSGEPLDTERFKQESQLAV